MNVSMTAELRRSVIARVSAGHYRTASEVIRAALRLLDKEEPFDGGYPPQGMGRDDHVGRSR